MRLAGDQILREMKINLYVRRKGEAGLTRVWRGTDATDRDFLVHGFIRYGVSFIEVLE